MYIEERRKKKLDILNNTGRVDVSQLAEEFGISKETIRRDLRALEETRQLLRTHGGALVQPSSSDYSEYSELPANIRSTLNMDSKKVICRLAASKIQDGDTIFVDNSTTCIYLCQYLPRDKQITILTNSIPFLNECAKISNPKLTVICLGGILNPTFPCMVRLPCRIVWNTSQAKLLSLVLASFPLPRSQTLAYRKST